MTDKPKTMKERLGRFLCLSRNIDPDWIEKESGKPFWQIMLPEANAVLEALLDPTPEMVEAMWSAERDTMVLSDPEKIVTTLWRAGVRAAMEE